VVLTVPCGVTAAENSAMDAFTPVRTVVGTVVGGTRVAIIAFHIRRARRGRHKLIRALIRRHDRSTDSIVIRQDGAVGQYDTRFPRGRRLHKMKIMIGRVCKVTCGSGGSVVEETPVIILPCIVIIQTV